MLIEKELDFFSYLSELDMTYQYLKLQVSLSDPDILSLDTGQYSSG